MKIGEGKGNFLKKVSLPLPKPHPIPSKTFGLIESLPSVFPVNPERLNGIRSGVFSKGCVIEIG